MANVYRFVGENVTVRRRPRVRMNAPGRLALERADGSVSVNALFLDMSDEGVAIFSGVNLAIGSEVQLEFTPTLLGKPQRVPAIVRNRRKYIYGLEFLPRRDGEEEQKLQALKAMLVSMGTPAPGRLVDRRMGHGR